MLETAIHSRKQAYSKVAVPAFRRLRSRSSVATYLLAMLLVLAIACGGNAIDSSVVPTETPGATSAPTAAMDTHVITSTPIVSNKTPPSTPAATEAPAAPTETPTNASTPVAPMETRTPTVLPTQPAPVASPTPVRATATVPPTETPAPIEGPVVKIGDALFPVDLALTSEQQSQGLSGREVMEADTGMLFIFQSEGNLTFWMKEMHFPLDIVWIGANCTVVDVTLGAPPPEEGQSLADLPRFSPSSPAQYVLEINAGEFVEKGIDLGDLVEFVGDLEGLHGC